MTRRVCWYLVGLLVLVTLAGCGRGFLQTAQREPWRAEAELSCLKSGQVREGAGVVRIDPISGPGICGAEFPLKVAALGESSAFGYADDLRPPAGIPGANQPRWPINRRPAQDYSAASARDALARHPLDRPAASNGSGYAGPMSIRAPGIAAPEPDPAVSETAPTAPYAGRSPGAYSDNATPLPRLGPSQGAPVAAIGPVALKPTATLACPLVSVLDRWITEDVQPAAMRWFGAPVVEIKQISAYSCRGMNGNSNAHISEHAFGNALDIAAFTLSDGRRISVQQGWKGMPEEQGFLRDVQGSACQNFNTVLAPGSNVYHYNHIHVDLMRRNRRRVICQPAAVSGAEIAARVSQRGGYASRDPGVTGSLGGKSGKSLFRAKSRDDDDWVEDESNIREH